jgi:ElaB/YqjD/DUF883 family membrane-anchored ribosome-binding protein
MDLSPSPTAHIASGQSQPLGTGHSAAPSATQKAGAVLRHELADLKTDLDALMAHEATLTDGELSEAYARIMARLGSNGDMAKEAAQEPSPMQLRLQAAEDYVRQRPLQALAAASLAGLAAGWLVPPHSLRHLHFPEGSYSRRR